MTLDLDKLEQLARAATPGPWKAGDGIVETVERMDDVTFPAGVMRKAHTLRVPTTTVITGEVNEGEGLGILPADAAFIAAARNAIPELIERVRAAEGELAEKNTWIKVLCANPGGEAERMRRLTVTEAIVSDLAACQPVQGIYNGGHEVETCALCGATGEYDDEYLTKLRIEHKPLCPHRRAVEASKL